MPEPDEAPASASAGARPARDEQHEHHEQPGAEQGVAIPRTDGRRSTRGAGRAVFAAAASAVDAELAESIRAERDWRRRYHRHARRLVARETLRADDLVAVARAGLAEAHERFEFLPPEQPDGPDGSVPLAEAASLPPRRPLHDVEVHGQSVGTSEAVVPYRGGRLRGDSLFAQLGHWVDEGTVEPSLAEAVRTVVRQPDWRDLSDVTIVALGAGAELSPVWWLSQWGATVLPIDLPGAGRWEGLLATLHEGRGRGVVPTRGPSEGGAGDHALADRAGADLTTDLPELCAWVRDRPGPLVVLNTVYADGPDHIRAALAADALTAHLTGIREDVAVAHFVTPTDAFAAPEEAVAHARRRFRARGARGRAQNLARGVSRGRTFAPNYPETMTSSEGWAFGIADTIIPQQGASYLLAKRVQRWRALTAAEDGRVVSANVAAPTATRSVTKNRALATAYRGAPAFGIEIFEPATTTALQSLLLVHDLRHEAAAGQPERVLAHPAELFTEAANHAGLWRNPFDPRSVLGFALLRGLVSRGR
ncbi:hypothetical protein ER308_00795 [Egibacter rhizosphaerae]|uniref:Uncharacterized protein n=1 Tax=Egibacter rhizosphaerae TaxID=1670831 RepID=A0A411YAK6_9ACTN|nr:hypothetical protein [Egibacter rhizosphaerae]QBI18250.1 hypothetical protein ER308_00795 [Egibacter rhizosphaerae]